MSNQSPTDMPLLQEVRDGSTLVLTFNDPARRNPLNTNIKDALLTALADAESRPEIRAIVLTGAGGHFSAGGDLSGMNLNSLAEGRARMTHNGDVVRALISATRPIIAAIEGWCAGGAIGVALCCDTLVAASGARFVASFANVGLIPDLGLIHTLRQRVGDGLARQMLLYAEPIDADRALARGLVDHVVPDGTALETALARARVLATRAPLSLAYTRQRLFAGMEEALAWERDAQAALFLSADHKEGKAAFFGKRSPVFGGVDK